MRTAVALGALVACAACHDFDTAPQLCLANGVCRSNIEQDGGIFALRPMPAALVLGPGGTALVGVTFLRPKGTADPVTLTLTGAAVDAGLTLELREPGPRADTELLVRVPLPFPAGTYPLKVTGARLAGSEVADAVIDVQVRSPAAVLLVDDDDSPNNLAFPFTAKPSPDDGFYRERLAAADDHTLRLGAPLSLGQLAGYSAVVWFTGASENNPSPDDRTLLLRWLDLGGKRLLLVAQHYPSDVGGGWKNATDPLLRDAIGAAGSQFFTGGPVTVTGVAGTSTAGLALTLSNNAPISTQLAVLNALPGTEPLMTAQKTEPGGDGGLQTLPVATRRVGVGDAGTSTVVFIGFPLVNAPDAGAAAAFDALRFAAGIP